MITRRKIIGVLPLLGAAAVAWPLAPRAQQPDRVRRIGLLIVQEQSNPEAQTWVAAFRDGLRALGWIEGRNARFDLRWATEPASIQQFAKELVALRPDLILSSSTPSTAALLRETPTIPIVFANLVDPVGSGFVASIARPGGNATGFVNLEPSMAGKWLELLKEIAPHVTRVAIPFNPETAPYADRYQENFESSAATLGVKVIRRAVHDPDELEAFVAAHAREPNGGLIPVPSAFMVQQRSGIAAMAVRHRLPAVSFNRSFVGAGGLLSYGNDIADNYRRAAAYVDRIFKGEKPGELPVQFPAKFELVINLRAAKSLGLDVPFILRQRADEVIE
jgi:putative ABC transport system substrate-binding protein